ncbi:cupin domain-containing protein [Arthrobacter castelli]|uniref:cupin domain-containing protein n=1 Tax=Arthrobacter castelli TaxID=271431 RepID=UPI0003FF86CB|nr:cupin domain-containing protein [Arthrobacter castelli]
MNQPLFPGGTAVSNLQVYDWEAPDGLHGGSPHMHCVSTEAYVVVAGSGEAHTISSGGFQVEALNAGSVLWFSPGTIHRLVNTGGLEIVVVMQNAGLPEAGDAVMTFPIETLRDPDAYAKAAALPNEAADHERADAARARRDLAMDGYEQLLAAVEQDGVAALGEFHQLAAALVQPRIARWHEIWHDTVAAETERTRHQLKALADGNYHHLAGGEVARTEQRPGSRLFGMCGRLQTWQRVP